MSESTIPLGPFPEKKIFNLTVLRKVFDSQVVDYLGCYPACSIYAFNKEWRKLQIEGALFIVILEDKINPYLFVLNSCSYADPEDFHFELQPSTQISIQGPQVFLKLERAVPLCIIFNKPENAQDFADVLGQYWKGEKNSVKFNDPSFVHAIKYLSKINI